MRIGFQADADLDGRILRGLRRVSPEIEIRTAFDAGFAGLEVTRSCGLLRILGEFLSAKIGARCQDTLLVISKEHRVPESYSFAKDPIAVAIEELVLIWSASESDEWMNRLVWIPL